MKKTEETRSIAPKPIKPTNPAPAEDCLISRVQLIYPDALIVHRLDMATSGPDCVKTSDNPLIFISKCLEQS